MNQQLNVIPETVALSGVEGRNPENRGMDSRFRGNDKRMLMDVILETVALSGVEGRCPEGRGMDSRFRGNDKKTLVDSRFRGNDRRRSWIPAFVGMRRMR